MNLTTTRHVALRCGAIAHPKLLWILERVGAGVNTKDKAQMFRDSWLRDPQPGDRYRLLVGRPGNFKVKGQWSGSVPLADLATHLRVSEDDLAQMFTVAEATVRKPDGRLTGKTGPAAMILEVQGEA